MLSKIILVITALSASHGRQTYRSRMPNGFEVPCPPGQEEVCDGSVCEGVGHITCAGAGQRNNFGKDFEAAGKRWTQELCMKDSDGDGVPNGVELGDPCCLYSEDIANIFPQSTYGLSHPGFDSAIPHQAPIPSLGYCQGVQGILDESRKTRTNDIFQDGEIQLSLDIRISNYTIPSQETTYTYLRFNLPSDKKYNIIAYQFLLDSESIEYVHHITLYGCEGAWQGSEGEIIAEANGGEHFPACQAAISLYAPGYTSQIFPKDAGFHIGPGTKYQSVLLEIHYDNPFLKDNIVDSSGFRVFYTPNQRKYGLEQIFLGPFLNIAEMTPNLTNHFIASLQQFWINETLAPNGISISTAAVHAHEFGRKIFTSIFRRNEASESKKDKVRRLGFDKDSLSLVQDIRISPAYSFANQRFISTPGVRIRNGDYVGVGCVFDTTKAVKPVQGGWGTQDEMCGGIIYVYPKEATVDISKTPLFQTSTGRVVSGEANQKAFSLPSLGVQPWIDLQSEIKRIGCPEDMKSSFEYTSAVIQTLENYCGIDAMKLDTAHAVYFLFIKSFDRMISCTEQCGLYLSSSFGCLAPRYQEMNEVDQDDQYDYIPFNWELEVEQEDDIFLYGYWYALYHNFPVACDQHLESYIMADEQQEAQLTYKLLDQ